MSYLNIHRFFYKFNVNYAETLLSFLTGKLHSLYLPYHFIMRKYANSNHSFKLCAFNFPVKILCIYRITPLEAVTLA